MLRNGIEVESYDAYEIDKYAIQTATHNFPDIKEHGDVFKANFTEYLGTINIMMGGSPCTYWSIAQATDRRETTASGIGWELFSQYVRALKEAKPKYFIYENNRSMARAIYNAISDTFGFEPIMINSALVSAQNRQRYYWVGKRNEDGTYSKVNVEQPEDRGILLKDILDSGMDLTLKDKSFAQTATYNGATSWNTLERHQRNMIAEPVVYNVPHGFNKGGISDSDKAPTLTTSCYQENHKVLEPVNATASNKAHTIKAQYHKSSTANFISNSGFNASAVAEPINTTAEGKAQCIRATSYKDGIRNLAGNNIDRRTAVAEPVGAAQRGRYNQTEGKDTTQHIEIQISGKSNALTTVQKDSLAVIPVSTNKVGEIEKGGQGNRIYSTDGKAVTQQASSGGLGSHTGLYAIPVEFENEKPTKALSCTDGKIYTAYEVKNGLITIKGKTYPIKLPDGYYIIRKLTVSECKRLQTVPEWYEFPVSNSQSYKMLGNGWTVDVIAHIINCIVEERGETNDRFNEVYFDVVDGVKREGETE